MRRAPSPRRDERPATHGSDAAEGGRGRCSLAFVCGGVRPRWQGCEAKATRRRSGRERGAAAPTERGPARSTRLRAGRCAPDLSPPPSRARRGGFPSSLFFRRKFSGNEQRGIVASVWPRARCATGDWMWEGATGATLLPVMTHDAPMIFIKKHLARAAHQIESRRHDGDRADGFSGRASARETVRFAPGPREFRVFAAFSPRACGARASAAAARRGALARAGRGAGGGAVPLCTHSKSR